MLLVPTATQSEVDGQDTPKSNPFVGPSGTCLTVQVDASAGVMEAAVRTIAPGTLPRHV